MFLFVRSCASVAFSVPISAGKDVFLHLHGRVHLYPAYYQTSPESRTFLRKRTGYDWMRRRLFWTERHSQGIQLGRLKVCTLFFKGCIFAEGGFQLVSVLFLLLFQLGKTSFCGCNILFDGGDPASSVQFRRSSSTDFSDFRSSKFSVNSAIFSFSSLLFGRFQKEISFFSASRDFHSFTAFLIFCTNSKYSARSVCGS